MITFIIIVVIIFVIFGVIGSKTEKNETGKSQTSRTKKPKQSLPSVSQLVDEIKTIEDFKKLRTTFNRVERSYANSLSENPNIEKKYRIYEEAFLKAGEKTLFKQFVPDLETDTSQEQIDSAYQITPISEYAKLRDNIGGSDNDWLDITANEFIYKEYETKPIFFLSLIEFQKLTNDNAKNWEEKVRLLNEFGKTNKSFVNEFYNGTKPSELGTKWIKEKMREFHVPLVEKLYELGYNTPDKLSQIDIEQAKNISGFGPKKIEQLKHALKKIKTA